MMRICVVDGNDIRLDELALALEGEGHETCRRSSADFAPSTLASFELVIIDLDTTSVDGVDFCRRVRRVLDVYIFLLSRRATQQDLVDGLRAGADDVITNPHGTSEILARVECVTRRTRNRSRTTLRQGSLEINPSSYEVMLRDRRVPVTRKEFELLYLLVSSADEVVPREKIMWAVWNETQAPATSRTIDTHVNALRRKLGDTAWITTVRGIGFRIGNPSSTPDTGCQPPVDDVVQA